jgi:hypothetical protein
MRNVIDDLAVDLVKADMPARYAELVSAGEDSYQFNRRAAFALNILGYDDEGVEELRKMLVALDGWIDDMEEFADDAERLASKAAASVL